MSSELVLCDEELYKLSLQLESRRRGSSSRSQRPGVTFIQPWFDSQLPVMVVWRRFIGRCLSVNPRGNLEEQFFGVWGVGLSSNAKWLKSIDCFWLTSTLCDFWQKAIESHLYQCRKPSVSQLETHSFIFNYPCHSKTAIFGNGRKPSFLLLEGHPYHCQKAILIIVRKPSML